MGKKYSAAIAAAMFLVGLPVFIITSTQIDAEIRQAQQIQQATEEELAAAFFTGTDLTYYTYEPPFTTHEMILMGLCTLSGISAFVGGIAFALDTLKYCGDIFFKSLDNLFELDGSSNKKSSGSPTDTNDETANASTEKPTAE